MRYRYGINSIFFWIIFISLITILANYLRVRFLLPLRSLMYDEIFFYAYVIGMLLWGAVSGLSYGEKNRLAIINHSFLILTTSMAIVISAGAIWIQVVDPSERFGYFEGLFWAIVLMTIPVFTLMFGFFISGYAAASLVRIARNKFKK